MKKLQIAAIICIAVGTLLILSVLIANGFDMRQINTEKFVKNTVGIVKPIEEIEVSSSFFDVRIVPTEEGEGASVCYSANKNIYHAVSMLDGKLTIKSIDSRGWYEKIDLSFGLQEAETIIEIRLPAGEYQQVWITTGSGDVSVEGAGKISLERCLVETVSGDVMLTGGGAKTTAVSTTSGDVAISGVACAGGISVITTSGDMQITDCTARTLYTASTSGDVLLERCTSEADTLCKSGSGDVTARDLTAATGIQAETTSGDVEMERSDALWLSLKTTSGDVELALRSSKNFDVESVSGDVDCPPGDPNAGGCFVRTASGQIKIAVTP